MTDDRSTPAPDLTPEPTPTRIARTRPLEQVDDEPEPTRAFTPADLAELRALLREDAVRFAPPPTKPIRAPRSKPPNLGPWLAVVVIVIVTVGAALAGLTLWLNHY